MTLTQRLAAGSAIAPPEPNPIDLPFGEYLPDLPPYGNRGATICRNVIPDAGGYRPFRALSSVSDALDARCQGAHFTLDTSGVVRSYAGDATKLYAIASTSWSDVSKAATTYDIASDANWEFVQDGNTLIATYYSTGSIEMQVITLGGSNFANLATSTRKPRFAHIAKVRDFIVGGRAYDSSDGAKPNRLWWSAFGDAQDWDPDAATQCDFQDLDANDGWIRKVVGGEYGRVFLEKAIYRATYVGGDVIFQLDRVVRNRGTDISGSVASLGRLDFFLSYDGFYLFDGADAQPIGKNKVDKTFLAEVDLGNKHLISSGIDPENSVYTIAYPTLTSNGAVSKQMHYHWPTGKWSDSETDVELIFQDLSKGLTLEDLDSISSSIDDLTPSLDSRVWTGGDVLLGAFDTSHKLATFGGSYLTARMETGDHQFYPGRKAYVSEARPLIDGTGAGTTSMQLATRESLDASPSYGSEQTVSEGKCDFDTETRYPRFRVNRTGGFTHAQGVQVKSVRGGFW